MTDSNKKTELEPAETAALDAMAHLQKAGFGSLAWLGTAWVETMSEAGSEWMTFLAERMREDVKTQHQILHCRDMSELQKIQLDFMKTAMDQYTAETGKMLEIGNSLMDAMRRRDS